MAVTKQTVKTEIVDPDNNPGVIAYRVGQLEKTVIQGFKEHNDKLDALTGTFATNERVNELERRIDNYTWYWRAVFTGLLLTAGGVITALIQRR